MAGLTAVPGIIIDRYHRGAVVLVGAATFAVPEQLVRLLERVSQSVPPYHPQGAEEQEAALELVARGMLREVP
jgi:hypothetical protein